MATDTPQFDYRTLSDMFDLAKREGKTTAGSVGEFSKNAAQATGRPDLFQQGINDSVFKRASVGVDRLLEATGLPTVGEGVGRAVGTSFGDGDLGANVGKGLPRGVLNFLPLAASGVLTGGVAPLLEGGAGVLASGLGAAGAGVLAGSQTYADTGSGAASIVSGLANAALPSIAHAGGQLALSRMGGVATDEAGHFIANTLGQKAVEYGASTAAAQGVMEVQGEAESKLEGNGFYNPLDPKHLVASIAGQLPFSVFDLLQMGLRRGVTTSEKVADAVAAPEQTQSAQDVPITTKVAEEGAVPVEEKTDTLLGQPVEQTTTTSVELPAREPVDPVKNAETPVLDADTAATKVSNAQEILKSVEAPTVSDASLGDELTRQVDETGDLTRATENVSQSVANDAVDHDAVAQRAGRGRPARSQEDLNASIEKLDISKPEDQAVMNVLSGALNKPTNEQTGNYSRNVQRTVASWLDGYTKPDGTVVAPREGGLQKLQGNLNRQLKGANSAPREQSTVASGTDREALQRQADELNKGLAADSNVSHTVTKARKNKKGEQVYRVLKETKTINVGSAGLENRAGDEGQQLGELFKVPEPGAEPEGSVGTTQVLQDIGSQFGTAMRNIDRETLEDELTPFVKGATDEQHSARATALQDQYAAYMDALTNEQNVSVENVNSKLKDQKHAFGDDEDVLDFAESPLVANVHSYLKDNVVDLEKLQELSERQSATGANQEFGVLGSGGESGEMTQLNSLNESNRKNSGLFGVKTLAAQFFKDLPPLEREAATRTAVDIVSKLKQENVPVGELVVDKEEGHMPFGVAVQNMSKTKMGTYLVDLLKQKYTDVTNVKDVANFVLAHETMHHVLNLPDAQLSPEFVRARKDLNDLLTKATPEEHKAVIAAMRGENMNFSQLTDAGATLADRGAAATETMANIGASLTMKVVEGDRGWLKDMTTYLPKPIGDFLLQASQWGKKMIGAVRGLVGMPDVSGVDLSPELHEAAKRFAIGLDGFSRTAQEVQRDNDRFMQMQNFDPVGFGVLQQAAHVNPLFTSGIEFDGPQWMKAAHDDMENAFGLKPEESKNPFNLVGRLYNKYLLQPSVDAVKHSFSKLAYGRPLDAQHDLYLRSRELISMLGADVKPNGDMDINTKQLLANKELLKDKDIQQAFGDIGRLQNRGTANGDGSYPREAFEKLPSMAKLSPQRRQAALNLANIVWNMTRRIQDFAVETQTKIGAESIGKVIQGMNRDFGTDKSRQLAGLIQDGVERLRSADTSVQADGNQLLMTVRGQVTPETFNEAYNFAQGERDRLQKLKEFYAGEPRFMTEQRLNDYLVRYTDVNGKSDSIGKDKREDALAVANDLQSKGATGIRIVDKAEQRKQGVGRLAPDGVLDIMERLEDERNAKLAPMLGGVDSPEYRAFVDQPQMSDMLRQELAAKSMVLPGSNRRLTDAATNINMLENQFNYLQASLHVLGKKQVRSSVGLDVMDPQFEANPDVKGRVLQHLENVFTPDSPLGRGIAKLNFMYYLGFSPSTAMVQSMHTVMSHAPYLASEGAGIVGAAKITASSAGKIAKWVANGRKWDNPEYDQLMRSAGPEVTANALDEIYNDRDTSLAQVARLASGQEPSQLEKLTANPITQLGNLSRLFFDASAKFNSRMALISGYDFARSKGMDIPDAQRYALEFHRTVNFVGGKLNRPTGLFSTRSDLGRTASQTLYSLESFNFGMIGMMGHYIADAKGNPNARKALVMMLGTQLVAAGALGMPGVGIAVGLLEKLFPTLQLQKNLVGAIQGIVGSDDETGGIVADIAQHGVLNQLGIDMSSRVAFGSSFLGARAYDGFSLEDAAGPTYSILKNAVHGVQQISQGNVVQGGSMLGPAFVKRLLNAYTNDGTVRSANGAPLLQPTTGQKFAMAIGFTPTQLSKLRQAQQIQERAQQVQRLEVGAMTREATRAVQSGDYSTARQIVQQYSATDPSFDPVAGLRSVAQHAVDEQNPVDIRRTNSNVTGLVTRLAGGAPDPSDVTRLTQRTQIEQGLGLQGQSSGTEYMNAFRTDEMLRQNPTMSRQDARKAVVMPKFQSPFLFGSS